MPLFEVNELGLKARLSDLLCRSFKHTISYLISFPLMRGEGFVVSSAERLGWPPAQRASGSERGGHRGPFPPHLNPPLGTSRFRPPWGEEVIFLTQLGLDLNGGILNDT